MLNFFFVGKEIRKKRLRSMLTEATIRGVSKVRAKIFSHVLNIIGQRSAHKFLRKNFIGETVASWYPNDIQKEDLLMQRTIVIFLYFTHTHTSIQVITF